tara:strand:+ start:250 stop:621 length:372 start_codon:yes stop_codon:yes gene_type:complete
MGFKIFGKFYPEDCNVLDYAETNTWVNYKPKEMMTEELKRVGNKGPGLRMRTKEIFEREKIMYRKVGKELIATLSDKDQFNEQTVHSCVISDDRVKLKYVLGRFTVLFHPKWRAVLFFDKFYG